MKYIFIIMMLFVFSPFVYFLIYLAYAAYRNKLEKKAMKYILEAKRIWLSRGGAQYQERIKDKYLYKCSLAVCTKAEEKPFDYVYKYFYKSANEPERIKILNYAENELAEREKLYKEVQALRETIVQDCGLDEITIGGRKIKDIIKNPNYWNIDAPTVASFVFSYTSPKGNSTKTVRIPARRQLANYLRKVESERSGAKYERSLMTNALRTKILVRDDYTCQICGLSTRDEPHLLLEVDHIIPVSKGGKTVESNLQTLCWKCNRTKSNKM